MERDGGLIQVALPINARGVNELLVFGDAIGRLELLVEEGTEGSEVDVEDAVGLGQEARGFGRGLGA